MSKKRTLKQEREGCAAEGHMFQCINCGVEPGKKWVYGEQKERRISNLDEFAP